VDVEHDCKDLTVLGFESRDHNPVFGFEDQGTDGQINIELQVKLVSFHAL